MDAVAIVPYVDAAHRAQVIALWDLVFNYPQPHNRPSVALDKKIAANDGLLFVAIAGETVVGTIMAGYDGHRGWIYSLAVSPAARRQGIGSRLMAAAEQALITKGCVKINLEVMAGNKSVTAFYTALGFAVEDRICMGKVIRENLPPI